MVAVTLDAERMKARTRTVRRVRRRTRIVSIFRPEGMPEDLLPRVRRDALPDHARYPDTGCELARACIACPLPRCQYDEPDSVRRWLADARDREIAVLRRRYRAPVALLCATYGLTRRTVYRIFVEQGVRTNRRSLATPGSTTKGAFGARCAPCPSHAQHPTAGRRARGSRVPLKHLLAGSSAGAPRRTHTSTRTDTSPDMSSE